jgi:hypothetical protein
MEDLVHGAPCFPGAFLFKSGIFSGIMSPAGSIGNSQDMLFGW